ncbi:MAG: hypothetical protein ACKPKO_03240, partial [Candidatus Fonsibacter sp.]
PLKQPLGMPGFMPTEEEVRAKAGVANTKSSGKPRMKTPPPLAATAVEGSRVPKRKASPVAKPYATPAAEAETPEPAVEPINEALTIEQQNKADESYFQFVVIKAMNEPERETVQILKDAFSQVAKGNLYTHLVRLIEHRAYGVHNPTDIWRKTI